MRKEKGIAANPFMEIVRHFAFINGLPFWLWKDQVAAITLYKESIKNKDA